MITPFSSGTLTIIHASVKQCRQLFLSAFITFLTIAESILTILLNMESLSSNSALPWITRIISILPPFRGVAEAPQWMAPLLWSSPLSQNPALETTLLFWWLRLRHQLLNHKVSIILPPLPRLFRRRWWQDDYFISSSIIRDLFKPSAFTRLCRSSR